MRALLGRSSARSLAKRYMLWSVAVATLYAISDEWHQSFLASRNAQAVDVLIDAIGALCGTLSWYLRNPPTLRLIRSRIP
jgi:VanZ family protein